MSIDLSSFSSFALESAPPVAAPAEGQTLTLQLRFKDSAEPMTGAITMRRTQPAAPNVQCAAVVAVDPEPFTITFE